MLYQRRELPSLVLKNMHKLPNQLYRIIPDDPVIITDLKFIVSFLKLFRDLLAQLLK